MGPLAKAPVGVCTYSARSWQVFFSAFGAPAPEGCCPGFVSLCPFLSTFLCSVRVRCMSLHIWQFGPLGLHAQWCRPLFQATLRCTGSLTVVCHVCCFRSLGVFRRPPLVHA